MQYSATTITSMEITEDNKIKAKSTTTIVDNDETHEETVEREYTHPSGLMAFAMEVNLMADNLKHKLEEGEGSNFRKALTEMFPDIKDGLSVYVEDNGADTGIDVGDDDPTDSGAGPDGSTKTTLH